MTMDQPQTGEVTFTFGINKERPDISVVVATLRDLDRILSDIAQSVVGTDASVEWEWPQPPYIHLTATVNGVSRTELERIVTDAYDGLVAPQITSAKKVTWPQSFGKVAKESARNILKRLEELESLYVATDTRGETTIDSADIGQVIVGRPRLFRAHSSVDGQINTVARRVGRLYATLAEHNTHNTVQCIFPQSMENQVLDLFKARRVVLEGLVSYRPEGTPQRITDVSAMWVRDDDRDLSIFIGAAPTIAGTIDEDEMIRRAKGDD